MDEATEMFIKSICVLFIFFVLIPAVFFYMLEQDKKEQSEGSLVLSERSRTSKDVKTMSEPKEITELEKVFHAYQIAVMEPVVILDDVIQKSIVLAKEALRVSLDWLVEALRIYRNQADMLLNMIDLSQWS